MQEVIPFIYWMLEQVQHDREDVFLFTEAMMKSGIVC